MIGILLIAHTDLIVIAVVGAVYGIRRVRDRHDRRESIR